MKKTLSLLLLILIAFSAQAQLLWRISGNGLRHPSYLVGTYHLASFSFADSIEGLSCAYNDTDQVCGEFSLGEMSESENILKTCKAQLLPDGVTLDSLFTADELGRIVKLVTYIVGSEDTARELLRQCKSMKPDMLNVTITTMLASKGGFKGGQDDLLDNYFQKKAIADGKPVMGLETYGFQLDLMANGNSLERQRQLLLCLADNAGFYGEQVEEMKRAYFSQDLVRLDSVMNAKLGNVCDDTPEEKDRIIYDRNADWASKMPAIMSEAPTLFAVGAGHMPGDRGLLTLLRKAGYVVEAVKQDTGKVDETSY